MKKDLKIKSLFLLLVFSISAAWAQGNLGQSGANFLQIAPEPRGAALGGATTAISRGADALYWNPAGAAHFEGDYDITFAITDWFIDTQLAYGAVVLNVEDVGYFGLAFTALTMDEMEITTPFASEGTGEFYNAGDLAVGVSYARQITTQFTFGATLKYIHEYIWNETASQVAFDIGSLYQTDFYNLRLGISLLNIAGKMEFSGDEIDARIREEQQQDVANNPQIERFTPEFRLPQVFQIGVAFEPVEFENNSLTILSDVNVPSDNEQRVVVGFEYGFQKLAFLRGALNVNDDEALYSFGAGININIGASLNSRLNYSFSDHETLGSVHRFGFGLTL